MKRLPSVSLAVVLAIAVGLIPNAEPSVAEGPPQEIIEMMNTIGRHVITKVETSSCQNFADSNLGERLNDSDAAFKQQITSQFIGFFQRFLQNSADSPPILNQASRVVFNKLSECGLANSR